MRDLTSGATCLSPTLAPDFFGPVARCWVCDGPALDRYARCRLEFREYAAQDPELHQYTGEHVWLVRCRTCGFGQPEVLPTLPNFFDRMYDQRWSDSWVDDEFTATYKDLIFRGILNQLGRRVPTAERRLLDVGAHAGRFMHLAQRRDWQVEGIELNPKTAAVAARRTGAVVHRVNAQALTVGARRFGAVTLTDVLEHIPEPVALLASIARLLKPGGWVAVKVPCGPGQWRKEQVRSLLTPSYRASLGDNLVHVNHFSRRSLALALERAGFGNITIRAGAPELPAGNSRLRSAASNFVRLAVFGAANLPGAIHTPLTLNLQAYAQLVPASE
jgi:SAM-dependent methyltransferase